MTEHRVTRMERAKLVRLATRSIESSGKTEDFKHGS